MRHVLTVSLLLCLVAGSVWAGTFTLAGEGSFAVQLVSTAPIVKTPNGAAVSGTITVSPAETLKQGLTSTFYLDNKALFVSALSKPELAVDTTRLSDGLHELRLDVSDGTQLALSTGTLPVHVLNDSASNVIAQTPAADLPFVKLYRKIVLREIVWFNNREADLEKHAYVSGGRVYITLTDLLRHVGGTIIWGPSKSYVLVKRNDTEIRFVPGSTRVYVNGEPFSLGRPTSRIDNRLFVPIRPVLNILGITTDWNDIQGRAYVNNR